MLALAAVLCALCSVPDALCAVCYVVGGLHYVILAQYIGRGSLVAGAAVCAVRCVCVCVARARGAGAFLGRWRLGGASLSATPLADAGWREALLGPAQGSEIHNT
jgi:hypothetical protein